MNGESTGKENGKLDGNCEYIAVYRYQQFLEIRGPVTRSQE